MLDNIFKFDVEFSPGWDGEEHLGRRHIYKNGPRFILGSGKSIRLINCVLELDEDGNLDTFRASVFADGFSREKAKVLMGVYENTGWKYDSFRDIYSDWEEERQAQMRAIKAVKTRTKKPFIETIRFLAKFVVERHTEVADRSEQERRYKERRERDALERRMAKLRDELERLRGAHRPMGESRMLLRMLVNEEINRFLFENSLWENKNMIMENYRFGNRVRGLVHETVNGILREGDYGRRRRLVEDIYVGEGGGYYGGSPIFSVKMDEDGTPVKYTFSPPGWDFDTPSQLEAAAVCASANRGFIEQMGDSELTTLPVVPVDDEDKREALYWLTGGNAEWNHGFWSDEFDIRWDEAVELLMEDDDIMNMLDDAIDNSDSFYDLVINLRRGEYVSYAADTLSDYTRYDDEEEIEDDFE